MIVGIYMFYKKIKDFIFKELFRIQNFGFLIQNFGFRLTINCEADY